MAEEAVGVAVLGQNEVGAAGAQRRYHANIGTAVALTVRDRIRKHALETQTAIQQIRAEPIVLFSVTTTK